MKKLGKFIITSILISSLSIGLIYILTDIIGLWYIFSAIILSVVLAVVSFTINYVWTWHRQNSEKKSIIVTHFIKYAIVGGSTMLLTWSLLYTLTEYMHLWYIVSAIIAWIIAVIISYLVNNYWTYGKSYESFIDKSAD